MVSAPMHIAQLMPLPLTVCCFSKIQTSFTSLIPAYPGSPGQRAVKRVCVCVCALGIGLVSDRVTYSCHGCALATAFKDAIDFLCF